MARNNPSQAGNPQLYLTNIDTQMTERDLNEHLSTFGKVTFIRKLLKDNKSQTMSALVQFENQEDAWRCRRELNGKQLGNYQAVASTYAKPFPKGVSVFVANMPAGAKVRDLEDHFSQVGNIIASKVFTDAAGVSLCHGFVAFDNPNSAEKAIHTMNNSQWADKTINVAPFLTILERYDPNQYVNLYVRGFGEEVSVEELNKIFGNFGVTTSIKKVDYKMADGTVKPYAFVCFKSHEEALRPVQALDGKEEEGKVWVVKPHEKKLVRLKRIQALKKQQEEVWKQTNVYIKGLDKNINEQTLSDICSRFGNIKSINIPKIMNISYDADGNKATTQIPRGIAYVQFDTKESAQKAISAFKTEVQIQGSRIEAYLWKPRKEIKEAIRVGKERQAIKMRTQFPAPYPMMNMPGNPMMNMPGNPMMNMPGNPMMGMPANAIPQPYSLRRQQQAPQPIQPQRAAVPRPPQASVSIPSSSLLPPNFSSLSLQDKKQCVGQIMFPQVIKFSNNNVAGKVTGMLLEMPEDELVMLVTDENNLRGKVMEAVQVLREAWKKDPEKLSELPR